MNTSMTTKTAESSRPVRPYSTKELMALYGVSRNTISKWLKPFEQEIGVKLGRYYTIAQITIIFEKLGWPGDG